MNVFVTKCCKHVYWGEKHRPEHEGYCLACSRIYKGEIMKPLPETLQQRFDELYTEYMSLRSKFHKIQFEFKKYRKGHKECDLQHVVIDALREENYALREQIKQMRESK